MTSINQLLAKAILLGVALVAGGHPLIVSAETRYVTNCADSGPGSLRETIAIALDGDIVDLSTYTASCNRLVYVTGGEIVVPQNNLTITGQVNALNGSRLWGNKLSRLIHHTGTGTLRLHWILFYRGRIVDELAIGGCLLSNGHLDISSSQFVECDAWAEGGTDALALGGALHAKSLNIRDGFFSDNRAIGPNAFGGAVSTEGRATLLRVGAYGNAARDGGVLFSLGGATITYSTMGSNHALHDAGAILASGGSVTLNKSLLTNNWAAHRCGALCVRGGGRTSIIDSTLVSNYAIYLGAGELSDQGEIFNSTIVWNTDRAQRECVGVIGGRRLHLQSSIIAANRCTAEGLQAYDISGRPWEGDTIVGANNLIGRSWVPTPADTISADPRLGPYTGHQDWPTSIVPLLPDSPAIDRGNNANNRLYDQRGPGYPRVVGGRADIGAYEVQEASTQP